MNIHKKEFTKKIQQDATIYQNFISYLCETQILYLSSVQQLHGQQPSTYAKPVAASAVLGS